MLPPFVFVNYNAKINPIKYSVKNGYFLTVHFIGSILQCLIAKLDLFACGKICFVNYNSNNSRYVTAYKIYQSKKTI